MKRSKDWPIDRGCWRKKATCSCASNSELKVMSKRAWTLEDQEAKISSLGRQGGAHYKQTCSDPKCQRRRTRGPLVQASKHRVEWGRQQQILC